MKEILSKAEVARLLKCSVYTVEESARKGELPGLKFGLSWVFPASALFKHLDMMALEQATVRRDPPATTRRRSPVASLADGANWRLYTAMRKLGLEPPSN
jgi:excisionase family DNA binding protein